MFTFQYRLVFSGFVFLAGLAVLGCGGEQGIDRKVADLAKGPKAVLFSVDGDLPAFSSNMVFAGLSMSQHRLERLMDKASKDLLVQEIIVHIGSPSVSFARAGEIGDAIARIAAAGKPVVCHVDGVDNLGYFIAAKGCPKILISPAGGIEAVGLAVEAIYFRKALDSLGVAADMIAIGKYKDASEPLMRDSMSENSREANTELLIDLHKHFVAGVAAGRKLDPSKIQDILDTGPHSAKRSVELGLVDEISSLGVYLAEAHGKYTGGVIDDYGKAPAKPLSFGELLKMFSGEVESKKKASPRIAIIPAIGSISGGKPDEFFGGGEGVYDQALVKTLYEALRDDSVRAVVLRIDSPGGSALASDNIWHAVRALAKKKPVVASMGDVAASGGYYIASGATEIFASPTTLTGSIGVVGGKIVIGGAAEKFGISSDSIKTAKRAGFLGVFEPFSDDERATIEGMMRETYDMFIDRIVQGRSLEREKIEQVAQGRVWSGQRALEHALIDKHGTLHDAIGRARELASVDPGVPVELYPEPKNLMDVLGKALAEPQGVAIKLSRRHAGMRFAMDLASLLVEQPVLTFAPILYEIH